MQPTVGRIVHYVSYGTPRGEYKSECRAAVITAVHAGLKGERAVIDVERVDLAVLNPTGMFFNQGVRYHDGAEQPGSPDCPDAASHSDGPHRYCHCGWSEAAYVGGTWHWPERAE